VSKPAYAALETPGPTDRRTAGVAGLGSVCYSPEEHNELILEMSGGADDLADAFDRIGKLKRQLVIKERELHYANLDVKDALMLVDIYKLKTPGFWKRNFGRSFWLGAGVGALTWEQLDIHQGE